MSPPDPIVELEALRKGLFALDWYVSELENVLSYNENAFEAAREYFLKYISDDSFPVEERDYVLYVVNAFMNVVRSDREQKDAFERRQEEERKRQEAEKNARRIRVVWKAFVVVLLFVTTVVLWYSETPLSAVVPILFILYVLLGDSLPLRLASSFLKKEDGAR